MILSSSDVLERDSGSSTRKQATIAMPMAIMIGIVNIMDSDAPSHCLLYTKIYIDGKMTITPKPPSIPLNNKIDYDN